MIKNSPVNARDSRDVGLIPGLWRFSGRGNGNPLHYSCLENSMDRGVWWPTAHGVAELDMTERVCNRMHVNYDTATNAHRKDHEETDLQESKRGWVLDILYVVHSAGHCSAHGWSLTNLFWEKWTKLKWWATSEIFLCWWKRISRLLSLHKLRGKDILSV